jgi:hypothetical protein
MDSHFKYFKGFLYNHKFRVSYDDITVPIEGVESSIDYHQIMAEAIRSIDNLNERIVNFENEIILLRNQMSNQIGIQISNEQN